MRGSPRPHQQKAARIRTLTPRHGGGAPSGDCTGQSTDHHATVPAQARAPRGARVGRTSSRSRMTLVERQQALLEQRGFSVAAPGGRPAAAGAGTGAGAGAGHGAGESPGSRTAPGSTPQGGLPQAGAGEQGRATLYWSSQRRAVEKRDLGHKCRECKHPFRQLGESIAVRRGARTELRYHIRCFSGADDPRTQAASSFRSGKWLGSQGTAAPRDPYRKMRTQSHW